MGRLPSILSSSYWEDERGAFYRRSSVKVPKEQKNYKLSIEGDRTQVCSISGRKETRLTGSSIRYAKFIYNTLTHPETLTAICGVAGIDLIPVMDIEISHVNILRSEHRGSIRNDHPVQQYRDDYPYICVLILGDTAHITGGQTLLREGLAGISGRDPPKMYCKL
jgi:hypothetical protein